MDNKQTQDEKLIELEEKINTSPLLLIITKAVSETPESDKELLKQKINMSPVLIMPKSKIKELILKHIAKKNAPTSFTNNQVETETDKEELLLTEFFENVCLYANKYFNGERDKNVSYDVAIASMKGFRFTTHFVKSLEKNGTKLEKNISDNFHSTQRDNELYKEFLKNIADYVKLLVNNNKLASEYDNVKLIQHAVKDAIESYDFIPYFKKAWNNTLRCPTDSKYEYYKKINKTATKQRRAVMKLIKKEELIAPKITCTEFENEQCFDEKAPKSLHLSIEIDENIVQYLDLVEDVFKTYNEKHKLILKKIITSELSLIMTNDEKLSEHLEYFKSKPYFDAELYAYCIKQEKKLNNAEFARKIMNIQSDRDLKTEEDRKKYNNIQMTISRLIRNYENRLASKLKFDEITLTLEKKKRREPLN